MNKKIITFFAVIFLLINLLPAQAGESTGDNTSSDLPISKSDKSTYVYRFWSDVFKGHFYTSSYSEASRVKNYDTNWKYENVAYSAYSIQQPGTIPVYRFWSDVFKGHFYTANQEEYQRVKDTDSNWHFEQVAFYVFPLDYNGSTQKVYRFWSPIFHHHFYTADETEMIKVRDTDRNWDFEGPAFLVPDENASKHDTTVTGELGETIEIDDSALSIDNIINTSEHDSTTNPNPNRLLSFEISLKNTSQEPMDFDPAKIALKDNATGKTYYPTTCNQEPALVAQQIDPGQEINGFVTYEVPKSVSDMSLVYASDLMVEKNNSISVDLAFDPEVAIISQQVVHDNFSGEQITGVVQNNTDTPVRYVKITATYYDASNKELGTSYAYAENANSDFLKTGEQANFKIWSNNFENASSYKLALSWRNY